MDELVRLTIIAATGVVAGAVNTIAGGGSLITLPVLIFLGIPATVANGTNRVGVVLQCTTATVTFHRAGKLDRAAAFRLLVPSCLGAAVGAWISTLFDDQSFEIVIGVVLIVALVAVFLPRKWLAPDEDEAENRAPASLGRRVVEFLVFVGAGFYGGFVQAGVGVLLLAGIAVVGRRDLVSANAIKVVLVLGFTVLALGILAWEGLVDWYAGAILAAGSALGGWLGTKLTVSWGPTLIRWVLVAVVLVSASRLLGLW